MTGIERSGTQPASAARSSRAGTARRVLLAGILGTLAAAALTTLAAAAAQAAGVDFVVAEGEEPIPLAGFPVVTSFFSALGVVLALVLLRWSAAPARRFVQTTVVLTVASLVPPLLSTASASAAVTLVGLHLLAAATLIPVLGRSLGAGQMR